MEGKQFNAILAKLPGAFKTKLERIRRFLNLGKASVMVGTGVSHNADVPSNVNVKLWTDLGQEFRLFRRRLFPFLPSGVYQEPNV